MLIVAVLFFEMHYIPKYRSFDALDCHSSGSKYAVCVWFGAHEHLGDCSRHCAAAVVMW